MDAVGDVGVEGFGGGGEKGLPVGVVVDEEEGVFAGEGAVEVVVGFVVGAAFEVDGGGWVHGHEDDLAAGVLVEDLLDHGFDIEADLGEGGLEFEEGVIDAELDDDGVGVFVEDAFLEILEAPSGALSALAGVGDAGEVGELGLEGLAEVADPGTAFGEGCAVGDDVLGMAGAELIDERRGSGHGGSLLWMREDGGITIVGVGERLKGEGQQSGGEMGEFSMGGETV